MKNTFGTRPDAMFRARPEFRERMRATGRTISWLARQLGHNRDYVSDVCLGKVRVSRPIAEKISKQIGLGPTRLFVEEGYDGRTELRDRRDRETLQAAVDGTWLTRDREEKA
jgi:plasmid maintenance system antidote protein VapI